MFLLRRAATIAAASAAVALFTEAMAAILVGGAMTAIGEWFATRE